MAVHFFFIDGRITLQERAKLKKFIERLFKMEGRSLRCINYVFCGDDFLLKMNKKYLNHDFYTDIVTFDLTNGNGPSEAEVYISVDRVRDNASMLKQSFKREIHRVIFHGALHLCGYADKNMRQRAIMRAAEDKYLKLYMG